MEKMTENFSPSELTLCSQHVCKANAAGKGENTAIGVAEQGANEGDPKKFVMKIAKTEQEVSRACKNAVD